MNKIKFSGILLVGIIFGFALASFFSGFQPLDEPKICLSIEPNYLLDCSIENQIVQVTSSESNLQKALDNEDYNCSINKKFDKYNILNCEQESNYTKYQIVFSKRLP